MLRHLEVIALVNLYWFSLPLAGYGLLLLLQKSRRVKGSIKNAINFALQEHFFFTFFMSFAFVTGLLGLLSIFCYLFQLPVIVIAIAYLILLALGLGAGGPLLVKNILGSDSADTFAWKGQALLPKLVLVLLAAVLLGDFLLGIYVGADMMLGADTFFHLSRIVSILNRGFNIQSGAYKGLVEAAYGYNVVYALYVIPAYLFHFFPAQVWKESFAFFRVMEWSAIFTLAWYICKYWLKDKRNTLLAASLATIFAVIVLSADFFTVGYPHLLAVGWLILFVIGVSFYDSGGKKASALPAFLAAFLLGLTHPTYALVAALFLGMLFVVRAITDRSFLKNKRALLVYLGWFAVLLAAPVHTEVYPSRLTYAQYYLLDHFPTIKVLGWTIKRPLFTLTFPGVLLDCLGILGFWYLVIKLWRSKQQWAMAASLVLFFAVIVYEPIGLHILHSKLPYWVIASFPTMNVIALVSVPLGVYALVDLASQFGGRLVPLERTLRQTSGNIIGGVAVLLLAVYGSSVAQIPQYKDRHDAKVGYDLTAQTYNSLHNVVAGNEPIVVADQHFSYLLPSAVPVKVIAVEVGHSNSMADFTDRAACEEQLLDHFNYADLKAVDAKYVVLTVWDSPDQKRAASASSYLTEVAHTKYFVAYKVNLSSANHPKSETPFKPCVRYQRVEAS